MVEECIEHELDLFLMNFIRSSENNETTELLTNHRIVKKQTIFSIVFVNKFKVIVIKHNTLPSILGKIVEMFKKSCTWISENKYALFSYPQSR